MFHCTRVTQMCYAVCCVIGLSAGNAAFGQVLDENFDGVAGTGGGTFFTGKGEGVLDGWDDNLIGEFAFAGTAGNAFMGFADAFGSLVDGVAGSGAGVIEVGDVVYDVISQDFSTVTGTGGGEFLAGGAGPDTFNFRTNWDDGIDNDIVFGGTFGGAVLNGGMSAFGSPTAGVGGTGGAVLDVNDVSLNGGGWYAGLQFDIGSLPGSVSIANAGFEEASAWTAFGNAFEAPVPVEVAPRSGSVAAKMFGAFSGPSGLFQDLPTQPGQTVTFSAYALTASTDTIKNRTNEAQLRIEWRDAANANVLQLDQVTVLNAPNDPNFPEDTWVEGTLSATAPTGAAFARVVLWFEQPAFDIGAVWWDDASVKITGPGATNLGQFNLLVEARGIVDGPNEVLGGIQLRIEDPQGNRLYTDVQATTGFQPIGDTLDQLIEADPNGVTTPGAFNRNASSYRIVVAFSDTNLWGSGGTIEIDNLSFSNDDSTGSAWYAGLFFSGLDIPTLDPNGLQVLDPAMIVLLADVKGDIAAPYAVRLEGTRELVGGINENFDAVTGDCGTGGCVIWDPNFGGPSNPGPGFSNDFDSAIDGEAAFAGAGDVAPFLGGGITVYGDPNGDANGNGCVTLEVQHLSPLSGVWFAGIDYGDQALASSDLSQVRLSADIRGRTSDFGGLGWYELRIEDAEGDRLAFQRKATGNWDPNVGGRLDTAVELPPADGSAGNGFDTNSSSYNVVVTFVNDANDPNRALVTTWISGGVLDVDNLFLTPATQSVEMGRFEFIEPGNTDFQTVGGFVTGADNITLETSGTPAGPVTRDFEEGAPGPGTDMNTEFDPALEGVGSFAGGNITSSYIETCASCGVGGGQAIRAVVDPSAVSDWWAGIYIENVPLDLSAGVVIDPNDPNADDRSGLFDRELTATINALGSTLPYGVLEIRVEDAETDTLYFHLTPNGAEQTIGGTLNNALRGFADPGLTNGVFDYNQEMYNIAIAFTNFTTPQWGDVIELVIDDWSYTSSGTTVEAPDSFTVTATFADEATAWGASGQLTVDNVLLAVVPNCNGDQSLDLADLAIAQRCLSGTDPGDCHCSDLDGDGDVDAADGVLILESYATIPPFLVLPE